MVADRLGKKARIKSAATLAMNFSFFLWCPMSQTQGHTPSSAHQGTARGNSRRPLVRALGWERGSKAQTEGKSQGLSFPLFSRALVARQSHGSGFSGSSGVFKHLKLKKGNLPL